MVIAKYPSRLVLPQQRPPNPELFDYLCRRFPKISSETWRQRFLSGKVLDGNKCPFGIDSPFVPQQTIYYFREVVDELVIPFTEKIIYQDDELLVACKPHFLPVTPGGRFVKECLVYRLRATTGNDHIVPLHRLDRHTAGLVMFSMNPLTRKHYSALFSQGNIEKTYLAMGHYTMPTDQRSWEVKNRIEQGEPWFLRHQVPGQVNAHSTVHLHRIEGDYAQFILWPRTGKTHQLRIHMSGLGFPIINDRYYPQLQPEQADDFAQPLQLIAKQLAFEDPVTAVQHKFYSERELNPSGKCNS
ncbi:MAG: pseudouridine synthase [Thermodesulfobacteriota bacterium]|nr:pseudouridine synthase [Thermodesulfobacteriota bacterium]